LPGAFLLVVARKFGAKAKRLYANDGVNGRVEFRRAPERIYSDTILFNISSLPAKIPIADIEKQPLHIGGAVQRSR
jgi:hypothetical protein